ncbi:Organic cation transporter protein [Armadillidium vulgare]|nr:Organic cation transporter protein [Armadillidium vulgare]
MKSGSLDNKGADIKQISYSRSELRSFIDESPRWLIVRGFHKKALKVLRRAEKANKVTLPSDEELLLKMREIEKNSLSESKNEENTPKLPEESKRIVFIKELITRIIILYRTPELRRRTFLMYTVFIVSSTVYYGLSLSAVNFKLNPFLYMVVSGVMEVPAYTVTVPIITRVGRVKPSSASFFICGVTIMALAFIPTNFKWLVICMAMVGKLFISAAYQVIYLMSSEIFPTEIRLQALGTCFFVSRIGSIVAPYVTDSLVSIEVLYFIT